jgi:hypothetical protein
MSYDVIIQVKTQIWLCLFYCRLALRVDGQMGVTPRSFQMHMSFNSTYQPSMTQNNLCFLPSRLAFWVDGQMGIAPRVSEPFTVVCLRWVVCYRTCYVQYNMLFPLRKLAWLQ